MKIVYLWLFLLAACAPANGPHKPVNGEGTVAAGSVGYDDVKPIFANYCAACHPARSGPDWLEYSQAKEFVRNGKLLRRAVLEKSMPPPGSPQAASLPQKDRDLLGAWARSGGAEHASNSGGAAAPAAAPSEGEKLAQRCVQCHGLEGPNSTVPTKIPRIAGQNEPYLKMQLRRFKWRQRIDPTGNMNGIALDLNNRQIEAVAHYFAHLASLAPDAPPALSAEKRARLPLGKSLAARACVACHSSPEYGNQTSNPSVPLLNGQGEAYLFNCLVEFRSGERPDQLMHEMAKLSDQDIEDLAAYFSSLRN